MDTISTAAFIARMIDRGWHFNTSSSIIDGQRMIELTFTQGTKNGSVMARGRGRTTAEAIIMCREDLSVLLDVLSEVSE